MAGDTPAVQLPVLDASDEKPTSASLNAYSDDPPHAVHSFSEASGDRVILSTGRTIIVVTQLVGVQLFTSFCNGIVVIGLPAISKALHIKSGLLLWPTSVFYLTAGSCLMLAGSIADVIGCRVTIMAANVLLVATAIGCGLSKTGGAFIAFRALQGVVNAMVVPASVSIVSTSVEFGRPRNLSFACLGFSGPLGFLLGLVLGGVIIDQVGFPPAFYLAAGVSFVLGVCGLWVLPADPQAKTSWNTLGKRLVYDLDWVGTLIASTGLATLSYALA
jgi:MFS family permease